MLDRLYLSVFTIVFIAGACPAQVSFKVTLPATVTGPVSGRLIVSAIGPGSTLGARAKPVDWPFWDEAQPAFGVNVTNLMPGEAATVNDDCTFYPTKPSELAAGKYRLQARLVVNRTCSEWEKCPGSLYSGPVEIELTDIVNKPRVVEMALTNSPRVSPTVSTGRVEFFTMKSDLLSKFYGHDVEMHAGIVLPIDYDPKKTYPAIYNVPGFGGDHRGALSQASRGTAADPNSAAGKLAREAFEIFLDAESPNGHTLFVNSENNGPRGSALVNELVLELEKKYPLSKRAEGRVLRGHSSGGWSTLWLALEYPDIFGATWSSSPDSVDFRRFQTVDIYHDTNMYFAADPSNGRFQVVASLMPASPSDTLREFCSYRKRARDPKTPAIPMMSIRRENLQEKVIGPHNDSGQQWDSWQAAYGPRGSDGNPAPLFDQETGVIDAKVAEAYHKFDIDERVRKEPKKYAPVLVQHVRLIVGDLDNFFLNEAVALLKKDVEALNYPDALFPEGRNGYIKIIPNQDHGSIFGTAEMRGIPDEMLAHFVKWNLIRASATPAPANGPNTGAK